MKKVMALFILVVVLLSGCNGRSNKGDDKITVTVSIEPQRYLVEKIAGDKVDVKTLLPQGAKPEKNTPNKKTVACHLCLTLE